MRRRWRRSSLSLVLILLSFTEVLGSPRTKRQCKIFGFVSGRASSVSIDDLIHGALSLVRPIFDTSQPIQESPKIHQQDSPAPNSGAGRALGAENPGSIPDDIPGLCKGNSRICQFIACSAQNFKHDPTLANLNLAAQVLGDTKLRAAISSNPDAISSTCQEQGLTESQCRIFTKGFQLIDRFITTIEKVPSPKPPPPVPVTSVPVPEASEEGTEEAEGAEASGIPQPLPLDDELILPIPARPKVPSRAQGSKTWSSKPDEDFGRDPPAIPMADAVSNLTPIPFMTPFSFTPPTPPAAPPLAFPTFPPLTLSNLLPTLPTLPLLKIGEIPKPTIQFSTDQEKTIFNSPQHVLVLKRINKNTLLEESFEDYDFDDVRIVRGKRASEYYDALDAKQAQRNLGAGSSTGSAAQKPAGQASEDYYLDAAQDDPRPQTKRPSNIRNCMQLLW